MEFVMRTPIDSYCYARKISSSRCLELFRQASFELFLPAEVSERLAACDSQIKLLQNSSTCTESDDECRPSSEAFFA
jgi:hypothetical protein